MGTVTISFLFLFTETGNSVTFHWETHTISPFPLIDFQPRNMTALKWDSVVTNAIKLPGTPTFNSGARTKRDLIVIMSLWLKTNIQTKQQNNEGDSKQDISVKVQPGLLKLTAKLPTTGQLKWEETPPCCLKELEIGAMLADTYQVFIARQSCEKSVHS